MKKLLVSVAAALAFAVSALPVQAQTATVESVNNLFNKAQTYSATARITLATAPTDVFSLIGSATKTVYVKGYSVSCLKTSGGYSHVALVKRTTGSAGGTSAAVTVTPHDSANGTATAQPRSITANVTMGTGTSVATTYLPFPAAATLADSRTMGSYDFFGNRVDQYLVLRGVTQQAAIYLDGQTLSGGVCQVTVTWMEQ